jgi:phosphoglycolate phosphatase-like HAD superfamily hydrolase
MGTVLGVDVDAILFDLDGVLTPTAELHRLCWRDAFTSVCPGTELTDREYLDNIDGRPRLEGVRAQLHAWGYDTRDDNIVAAVAERKDAAFTRRLDADGMRPYPGSTAFLDAVEAHGIEIAVVSSSRNARRVLHAAGLATGSTSSSTVYEPSPTSLTESLHRTCSLRRQLTSGVLPSGAPSSKTQHRGSSARAQQGANP